MVTVRLRGPSAPADGAFGPAGAFGPYLFKNIYFSVEGLRLNLENPGDGRGLRPRGGPYLFKNIDFSVEGLRLNLETPDQRMLRRENECLSSLPYG